MLNSSLSLINPLHMPLNFHSYLPQKLRKKILISTLPLFVRNYFFIRLIEKTIPDRNPLHMHFHIHIIVDSEWENVKLLVVFY